jgi:hypothetical protein
VERTALERLVRVLAAEELGGRGPMSPGAERASRTLARALEAAGIEPAGEGGTFFQPTGARRFEYPSRPRLLLTREDGTLREGELGVEFTLDVRGTARATAALPLRFFYDYNHLRMPLEGNPGEAIHFSASPVDRARILAEKGIEDLGDWGLELVAGGAQPGRPLAAQPARLIPGPEVEACERVVLRGDLLAAFLRREFTHVQLLVEEAEVPSVDRNVVGRLRGRGTPERPELAREVVLLSAHYDGLAPRPSKQGPEQVFAGANGNASGCAALLEVAEALAAGPPPARTFLFLFATGAETGSSGLARYQRAPAEPLADTVVNLNLDGLGRADGAIGAGRLWLGGFERSNLGPAWQAAGLALLPDPLPELGRFEESKFIALAREGLVTVLFSSRGADDHRPSTRDRADGLDYAHLESVTKTVLAAARSLADGSLAPAWNRGQAPRSPKPQAQPEEGQKGEGPRTGTRAAREDAKALQEELLRKRKQKQERRKDEERRGADGQGG